MCVDLTQYMLIYGLIKYVKVSLATNKYILVIMDIVVIDVSNAWGMLLSRKSCSSIGVKLQMELPYIPYLS